MVAGVKTATGTGIHTHIQDDSFSLSFCRRQFNSCSFLLGIVSMLSPEVFETGAVELALVCGESHRYFKHPYTHYSVRM